MYPYTQTHIDIDTHGHTHAHTEAHTDRHRHTQMPTHRQTDIQIQTRTYTGTHTCTHRHTCIHAQTQTHICTHMHMLTELSIWLLVFHVYPVPLSHYLCRIRVSPIFLVGGSGHIVFSVFVHSYFKHSVLVFWGGGVESHLDMLSWRCPLESQDEMSSIHLPPVSPKWDS